jgi:hypothetical protein
MSHRTKKAKTTGRPKQAKRTRTSREWADHFETLPFTELMALAEHAGELPEEQQRALTSDVVPLGIRLVLTQAPGLCEVAQILLARSGDQLMAENGDDAVRLALACREHLYFSGLDYLAMCGGEAVWRILDARADLPDIIRQHHLPPDTTPAATPTPPAIPPKTPANTPAPPPPSPEPIHAQQMELEGIVAQIRPTADIYHGQLRLHCLRWGIWLCRHSRWTPFTAVNTANDIIAGRRSRALSALLTPRDYRTLRSLGHIAHGRTAAQAVNRLCAQCSLPPFHYPMPGYPLSASPALEESPRISSPLPREQAA